MAVTLGKEREGKNNAVTIEAPVNPGERHIAVALVVDTSTSMMGRPIEELNRGLQEFGQALLEDDLALGRADITIISFNSTVQTEMGFMPAVDYQAPKLAAGGLTSLNEAIDTALNALDDRKTLYRNIGMTYYRPWLFVLTDGEASDDEREGATKARLREYIEKKRVVYMPMGIGERANKEKLADYYPEDAEVRTVLSADAKSFKEAFVWLSNSISVISNSDPTVSKEVTLPQTPSNITVGIM